MGAKSDDLLDITLPVPGISRELPISGPPFTRPDPLETRKGGDLSGPGRSFVRAQPQLG